MIRSESIKYKMLRYGVEYGELYASGEPTLRMSGNGEIKCSLQGTFLPFVIDARGQRMEANWLIDEIKPVLTINGVDYPLGVLMPASITPRTEKSMSTLDIQAYDRCWRVRDTKVESRVYFASGTKYLEAVVTLLAECGVATISKTDTTLALTNARDDWEPGTDYLSIVNELLKEINYKPLWFNQDGAAILEPASIPTAKNIKHTFSNKKPDPRNPKEVQFINVYPRITKTTDIYQKPNVFIAICSNPDKSGPMSAKAENKNPESPLSIQRRGRKITQVQKVNNVPNQEALQAYVDQRLAESMVTGEIIELQTALQPGFGVDDVSAVNFDDLNGICIEREWTMQLKPGGVMTHKMERVVVNIG